VAHHHRRARAASGRSGAGTIKENRLSKNVAVYVDVANIFYAAKAAGVDIDYVTLLKAASAGRDLVRAYAYTGLDPDNENQRNFHDFLRRHGYKVVSKDIRKYGDGKVKANLDIELVVDMMKTARNLDIAIVVSGDGDFAPAIRAVQEMGVRVEVISFRGNTSSDLIDVADVFTEITQVAKVEKGSSRSGRRVAGDDEDLSMTEVPDKMTEGTGDGRRRRGGRARSGEPAAARRTSTRSRAAAAPEPEVAAGDGEIVVLPGEKLSRAGRSTPRRAVTADIETIAAVEAEGLAADEDEVELVGSSGSPSEMAGEPGDDAGRRRRRRRGGRGRGRGRGRGEETTTVAGAADGGDEDVEELEPLPEAPRRAAFSFGSVWDSQLGVPAAGAASRPAASLPVDDEDLEEPEIPEYLLAERRQREQRNHGRGGPRGRGGAYAAAMDRERFGHRGTPSRYAEPPRREPQGGGRPAPGRGPRFDRPERPDRGERPAAGSGGEPWSEVPPEIEAMLRSQLAASGGRPVRAPSGGEARRGEPGEVRAPSATPTPTSGGQAAGGEPADGEATAGGRGRGRGRGRAASGASSTRTAASSAAAGELIAVESGRAADGFEGVSADGAPAGGAKVPSRRRAPSRTGASRASAAGGDVVAASVEAAPKQAAAKTASSKAAPKATATRRRVTPRPAAGIEASEAPSGDVASGGTDAAPKRRTRRTAPDTAS